MYGIYALRLCCFTLCCLNRLYSFPVWCLGQDVKFDCIGSWSLHFHLLDGARLQSVLLVSCGFVTAFLSTFCLTLWSPHFGKRARWVCARWVSLYVHILWFHVFMLFLLVMLIVVLPGDLFIGFMYMIKRNSLIDKTWTLHLHCFLR